MEVIVSAAVSVDGYLDDCSPGRLKLSSPEDWRAVQALRARCDAILVGAGTVRMDNPSLVIRDEALRRERVERGMDADITKVTVTSSGLLDPRSDFFGEGGGKKIVFATSSADAQRLAVLSEYAEVVRSERITARYLCDVLSEMGCRRLMVEGGSRILTMFFEEGAADVFRLAVAPFFVGNADAPRIVTDGKFISNKDNRMYLAGVEMLGDTAVMTYKIKR